MRKLTLSGAVAMMLVAGGTGSANAGNAPWCAWYGAYTYSCSFHTFQQCLDTISGVGGLCSRNVYVSDVTPRRRSRF